LGQTLVASLRPPILDDDVAAVDPAELTKPLHESGDPLALGRSRARTQEPDSVRRLLRAHRERPRCCRAAEQSDEGAPSHSITSSARASSVGDTSIPSAFAVARLMTKSNLVGCTTGKSAGLAPLRMRAAYMPAWRQISERFAP